MQVKDRGLLDDWHDKNDEKYYTPTNIEAKSSDEKKHFSKIYLEKALTKKKI